MTFDWKGFLTQWQQEVSRWANYDITLWNENGFPDPTIFQISTPNDEGIRNFELKYPGYLDDSLRNFFEVSDGWELFPTAGFESRINKIVAVDFVKHSSREIYTLQKEVIAESEGYCGCDSMSELELESALLLTNTEGREVVMLISNGEIILYKYDSIERFANFWEFMHAHLKECKELIERDFLHWV